jgi:hypothetical protein
MKKLIKSILKAGGYEISKMKPEEIYIGSDRRPVGNMEFFLVDIKERGLNCNTILDVGANSASWSRMAKKVFPLANFCLIEPQVEMKNELENFCKDFENSIYVLAGAGSKEGFLTLTVWDDFAGSSFLPLPDDQLRNSSKQR